MKKTLAALAVLGAFAGTALAADVTLYGIVDEGFNYTHLNPAAGTTSNTFTLDSGINMGSRFGLKGAEDLGNGYKVGFVLENGFNADSGTLAADGTLFNREAQVYVAGSFGKLSFGRLGILVGGTGTYGLIGGVSPLGTSFGAYTAQVNSVMASAFGSRVDNSVVYQSPTFAGVTAYAQYSFGTKIDDTQVEGQSSANRYLAGGLTYANGGLKAVLTVDSANYSSWNATSDSPVAAEDNSLTVTLGGSYDFGPAAFYLGGQYFDQVQVGDFLQLSDSLVGVTNGYLKGYGLTTGVSAPVFGGTVLFGVSYLDAKDATQNDKYDVKRLAGTIGYTYNLSKRTTVYAAAGLGQDKYEPDGAATEKTNYTKALVGLTHKF